MKQWVCDIAVDIASTSTYPQFRHGAVIELGGRIMAIGINTLKSSVPDSSMSVHAEISALKRFITRHVRKGYKSSKADLYVTRLNKQNAVMYSCPCEKCYTKILGCNLINNIYFSTYSDNWGRIKL